VAAVHGGIEPHDVHRRVSVRGNHQVAEAALKIVSITRRLLLATAIR
jgi:hypothetical protein